MEGKEVPPPEQQFMLCVWRSSFPHGICGWINMSAPRHHGWGHPHDKLAWCWPAMSAFPSLTPTMGREGEAPMRVAAPGDNEAQPNPNWDWPLYKNKEHHIKYHNPSPLSLEEKKQTISWILWKHIKHSRNNTKQSLGWLQPSCPTDLDQWHSCLRQAS